MIVQLQTNDDVSHTFPNVIAIQVGETPAEIGSISVLRLFTPAQQRLEQSQQDARMHEATLKTEDLTIAESL